MVSHTWSLGSHLVGVEGRGGVGGARGAADAPREAAQCEGKVARRKLLVDAEGSEQGRKAVELWRYGHEERLGVGRRLKRHLPHPIIPSQLAQMMGRTPGRHESPIP